MRQHEDLAREELEVDIDTEEWCANYHYNDSIDSGAQIEMEAIPNHNTRFKYI